MTAPGQTDASQGRSSPGGPHEDGPRGAPGGGIVAGGEGLLARHPWLPFVLPLAVYMLVGAVEPTPPRLSSPSDGGRATGQGAAPAAEADQDAAGGVEALEDDFGEILGVEGEDFSQRGRVLEWGSSSLWGLIKPEQYPIVYCVKIVLTMLAMAFVWPGYRQFPFHVSPLAIFVGAAGVVLWIGIASLGVETLVTDYLGQQHWLLMFLGLGERPSYNPLAQLAGQPGWAYAFLAVRFFGLVLIVPVIEEFFLRGFLMRYIVHEQWWQVPFGEVTRAAVIVGTLFPVLYHPEKLAALVWFSLITWLMVRTKNIWDCVAAHAVTNLLLGVYVVLFGKWWLW